MQGMLNAAAASSYVGAGRARARNAERSCCVKKRFFGVPRCVLLRAKRGRPALLVLPGFSFPDGPSRGAEDELQPKAGRRLAGGTA
jgi:hypothetical protein